MVEIKAIEKPEGIHKEAQAISCCKAYNVATGLLIIFDSTSLEFKWIYNKSLVNHEMSKNPVQDK